MSIFPPALASVSPPVEWLQPVLQFPMRVMQVRIVKKKSQIKAESII